MAWLLWGEGGEARARGSLRQALTTLRREVPEEGRWLEATAETVAVDHRRLWVDAREAEALLSAGEPVAGAGAVRPGGAAGRVEPGRGGVRRVARGRAAALARAGDRRPACADRAGRGGAGQHRELLALGRRLLKLEPWSEEAHRAVMWALAGLGRHGEALRQYQIATEALRAELGVAPGAETERLLMQIRARRVAPAASRGRAEPEATAEAPARPAAPGRSRRAGGGAGSDRGSAAGVPGQRAGPRHPHPRRGRPGQDHLLAGGAGAGARRRVQHATWCRSANTATAATCRSCGVRWARSRRRSTHRPRTGWRWTSCRATPSPGRGGAGRGARSRSAGAGAPAGRSRRWWRRPVRARSG